MNRRDFVTGSACLLAGAAFGPVSAARAQRNLPVIGVLDGGWDYRLLNEVRNGLADNGFSEGRDFRFEQSGWRHFEYQVDQLVPRAGKLVEQKVAVILAFSSQAALAAKAATTATPVIFLADAHVAVTLRDRASGRGDNLTGAAILDSDFVGRRIEIARELVPAANLIVLVTDPTNRLTHDVEVREAQAAADAAGVPLSIIAWAGERGLEPGLAELPRDRKPVLVFGGGLPFYARHAHLAYLAVHHRIAGVHGHRPAVEESGGLASFGTRLEDGAHLMGAYAARALRGEKPADLPVRQIKRTELVFNLWPARSLGLQLPATLLARADEVIK
jgi:putative tryptophan/tyrosine transport system substrate-binding protein